MHTIAIGCLEVISTKGMNQIERLVTPCQGVIERRRLGNVADHLDCLVIAVIAP